MTKKQSVFNEDWVTELAKNCKTQDELFGREGIVKQLVKAILQKNEDEEKPLDLSKMGPYGAQLKPLSLKKVSSQ